VIVVVSAMKPVVFAIVLLGISGFGYAQGCVRFATKPIDRLGSYRCYPQWQDSKVGLGYTMLSNQLALKANLFVPSRYVNVIDVDWRTPVNGTRYFDLHFARHFTMRINSGGSLDPAVGYKRIKSDRHNVTVQGYVSARLSYTRWSLAAGYAHQRRELSEGVFTTDDGIAFHFYKEFFEQLILRTSTVLWFDQPQFSLSLLEEVFQTGLFVGVGWEKVNDWSEFDVTILVRVNAH
jgi:hypothetical protein